MDRNCLKIIAEKTYSNDPVKRETEIKNELFACVADGSDKRPSVETSLHNLLNFPFVVHTHPTLVNGLMCANNSQSETKAIFGDEVLLVEYTDPGYILFKLVEKRIGEFVKKKGREPQIIFLENHGVFVSANSIAEIKEIYSGIFNKLLNKIKEVLPSHETKTSDITFLKNSNVFGKNILFKAFTSKLIQEFTKDKESFRQADTSFSPDNIVYCKAHYLFSSPDITVLLTDYQNFKNTHGYFPKVIGLAGGVLLCLEESEKSVNTVYEVFSDLLKISFYTRNFGGPRFMNLEQIEFIDNWEVENYRRNVGKEVKK